MSKTVAEDTQALHTGRRVHQGNSAGTERLKKENLWNGLTIGQKQAIRSRSKQAKVTQWKDYSTRASVT